DVVLRKQEASEALPNAWLVIPHPKQLRQREVCERGITSQLDDPLASHSMVQPVAFLLRSLVAPDNRRSEHLIVFIEQHCALHLVCCCRYANPEPLFTMRRGRLVEYRGLCPESFCSDQHHNWVLHQDSSDRQPSRAFPHESASSWATGMLDL